MVENNLMKLVISGLFGGQFSTQSFGSVSGQYIPDLNIKSVETIQNSAFSQSTSNSEQPFQGFGSNQIFIDSVWVLKIFALFLLF